MKTLLCIFVVFAGITASSLKSEIQSASVAQASVGAEKPESTGIAPKSLKGQPMYALNASYLNVTSGTLFNPSESYDFAGSLKNRWGRKTVIFDSIPGSRFFSNRLLREYKKLPRRTISLHGYIAHVDSIMREMDHHINWNTIEKRYRLSKKQVALLREVSHRTAAKDMVACSMTELMAWNNGANNAAMFDFLLQNAGMRFLESIPCSGEREHSFGMYQSTNDAVNGVQVLQKSLDRKYRISDKHHELFGDAHHRLAYLLVIHNALATIKKMDARQISVLQKNLDRKQDEVMLYLATAHNNPKFAREAFLEWIHDGCDEHYLDFCNEKLKAYGTKTKRNREALDVLYPGVIM